jgi:hypothetical protein
MNGASAARRVPRGRLSALALAALLLLAGCGPFGDRLVPMVNVVNDTSYHLRLVQQVSLEWLERLTLPPHSNGFVRPLPSPCFTADFYALSDDGRVVAVHHPPLCNDETWTIGPEATPNGTPTLVSPAPSYGPTATP